MVNFELCVFLSTSEIHPNIPIFDFNPKNLNPMKVIRIVTVLTVLTSISISCAKTPTACIQDSVTTANVGDTIRFTSCSVDADTYIWRVDDGVLLNPISNTPFYPYHAIDAGSDCENWVELSFSEPGTYSIDLINPLLKQGTCSSSEKSWSKQDETSVQITITQ